MAGHMEMSMLADRVGLRLSGGGELYVWGRVRALSSSSTQHRVIVRYRTDVSPGDVVVHRMREMSVLEVNDLDGRRLWLSILTTTGKPLP